jgi:hypothetical protein
MKKTAPKPKPNAPANAPPSIVVGVFGRPNSGKSYLAQQIAKTFAKRGHTIIVYNPGRPEDWANFEKITILENPKSKESDGKELLFEHKGKVFEFIKNFPILFKGKQVKIYPADDPKDQEKFFKAFAKSERFQKTLLVIDDCTAVLGSRFTPGVSNLTTKAKHNQVATFFLGHSLDAFPPTVFGQLSHLILFETNAMPTNTKLNRLPTKEGVVEAYEKLPKLPKYSYYKFNNNDGSATLTTLHNGKPRTVTIKKQNSRDEI